jgi:DNA-directed RNA polymerase specialized sigma24 family protein
MTVFPVIRAFSCACDYRLLRVVALTGETLTFPKTLKFEKRSPNNETIFLDHYEWLLDWARQHTQGAADEAEDLVQDLYVRFVQMKNGPTFQDEDAIRAYLYTSLKNLFISRKLRSGRDAVSGLLAVDFDSVDFAIASIDRSQLLHVRSDLAGICEYACVRRKTSRAGSVLILRFFLGFLSTEVMALLRARRSNVDTLIETARLEGKAYLSRPGVLRFLSRADLKAPAFPRYLPEQPEALFAELQRRIFSEAEGVCLPAEELRERYSMPDAPTFSTQEIAHLASCRKCLGIAARCLGLPDLALRFFDEGDHPGGTNTPATGTGEQGLKTLRRRLRETYEHRPKKLQIVVDGEVRGVQTITGASSSLQIALPRLSQPGFVEVLSEQGFGLMYFDPQQENVEVPSARTATVELSDGRVLSVSLTLVGGSPVIDVSYYDPLLEPKFDGNSALPFAADPEPENSSAFTNRSVRPIAWVSGKLANLRLWRPWLIGIVALSVLLALLQIRDRRTQTAVQAESASLVLSNSIDRYRHQAPAHGAVRRVFALEVISLGGRRSTSVEVDVLRSADRPLETIRVRAKAGEVVASHAVDARGHIQNLANRESGRESLAATERNVIWQHIPDPADFRIMAGDDQSLALIRKQEGYELSFKRGPSSYGPSVVEAQLVLAVDTLHPLAEHLRVQEGEDTTDYQFRETRFEILSPQQVTASDFETNDKAQSARQEASPVASAHLALEALELLEHSSQAVQSAINIERRHDGTVEVEGVLPTMTEARSLADAFRSLGDRRILNVDLHSSDEPAKHNRMVTNDLPSSLSITAVKAPLDAMVRDVVSKRGATLDALDDRTKQVTREVVERSARIRRAAWLTNQISSRDFGSEELRTMGARDRNLWLTLLSRPLSLCEVDLESIYGTLFSEANTSPPLNPLPPILTVRELAKATDVFRQDAEHLDGLIVEGFTVSEDVPPIPVSPAELLEQLTEVQREERRLTFTVQHLQQATQ